jgi:hypothetical protein
MILFMKTALLARITLIRLQVKALYAFLVKVSTHKASILFCKAVFVTALLFVATTNVVPLYEISILSYDRAILFFKFLYNTTFLYFSAFTGLNSKIIKLEALADFWQRKLDEFDTFRMGLSSTLEGVVKSVGELFSSTTSMKADIEDLMQALLSTQEEIAMLTKNIKAVAITLGRHKDKTDEQFDALKLILKDVKTPIRGTQTAGVVFTSKIVGNKKP